MAIKKPKTAEGSKRLIYVGPTLSGSRLIRYQVFVGGLPKHIDEVLEKTPQIKSLFVAPKDLVAAEKAISTKGTPMHKYFKMVSEEGK